MEDLPSGLAEPLHLLPPFPYGDLLAALVPLLLLIAWWWARRPRRARPSAPAPPPPPAAPRQTRIGQAIDELERRTLAAETYRQGCHQLAALLRRHFDEKLHRPLAALTVSEIAKTFQRPWLTRCLSQIAKLQFGRRVPTATDFGEACDLARELTGRGKRG